jgi:hypothetical protein
MYVFLFVLFCHDVFDKRQIAILQTEPSTQLRLPETLRLFLIIEIY